MAKRSFETLELEEIQEDDSETEQESELEEEETDSEDGVEEEQREERRVMIRVVPRERFERSSLSSNSASCSGGVGVAAAAAAANVLCCQADECVADLKDAKQYHRRHKVCEPHAKASFVLVKGIRQRFCQQCFMKFQSLMVPREVVGIGWLVIIGVGERSSHTDKQRMSKDPQLQI
ncbi:hypothetical protein REPUB_Repub09cG0204800 [Reevesia pubescens]